MRTQHNVLRRTVLRGLGASVALPLLESLLPGSARADAPVPPKRLLYYYVPNGFNMDAWMPIGSGTSWQPSEILAPLAPHMDQVLVVSGLDNLPGNYDPDDAPAGAHFTQTSSFLTCVHAPDQPFEVGKSIDQVAAEAIGYVTPQRSLQLGIAGGGTGGGSCGSWPCAYLSFISYADASTPIALQTHPPTLFAALFGPGALGQSEADFNKRKAYRLKILDVVNEDAKALRTRLGAADRIKLDKYLTAVDETEVKVNALQYGLSCDPGEVPSDPGADYLLHLELMLDIMALAFQCDVTRIISFMTYRAGAAHGVPYDWVDYLGNPIQEDFHTLSHHMGDPTMLAKVAAINTWEVEVFAGLIARLKAMEDFDGSTVLDNSMLFFSSEMSDGQSHSASNMPVVVAGGGQGAIQTGQHLVASPGNNCYADLHIALVNAFGVPITSFGDGTGPLPGVLV